MGTMVHTKTALVVFPGNLFVYFLYTADSPRYIKKDQEASSVFWHMTNYLAPPIDAVHPRLIFKVLLHYVRHPNM